MPFSRKEAQNSRYNTFVVESRRIMLHFDSIQGGSQFSMTGNISLFEFGKAIEQLER